MNEREQLIQEYIDGYNNYDVDKMVAHFDSDIIFTHISGDAPGLRLEGIEAFRAQAEAAKAYFSGRRQTATSFTHRADETEVGIDYRAVLATDLSDELKKGAELRLQGRSVFGFRDGKIIRLTDIS